MRNLKYVQTFSGVYFFFFFTLDEFEKYCNDVSDTAAWGGQLEVRIYSHNPAFS